MVGNNAAALASQKEAMLQVMPELMNLESVFWPRIKQNTTLTPTSTRPTRVATQPITGGKLRVFGADGQRMGRGSGPQEVFGYISCASYLQASEYTAQSQYATDSSAKAINNYVSTTHEQAFKTLGGYLDVFGKMDGSNTIDTIVSIASGNMGILVNNANFFQSNQTIDIWSAVGGVFRGAVEIDTEDSDTNTIWLTTPVPAGTSNGDVLMVSGSSGQANSGMFGILYYMVNQNVGNYLGIPRAAYPGRYTAQGINLGGQSLTPAAVRAIRIKIINAMGGKVANSVNAVAYATPAMQQAWENNSLAVQTIVRNEVKGDSSADMLPKDMSPTIGGKEFLIGTRAIPGRIDMLDLDQASRIETKAVDYYSAGGLTEFPVGADDGSIQSSNLFYIVFQQNILWENVRTSSFLSNIAVPRYLS